jgi:GntR family phosphonate transport system transcriptional regulator
MTDHPELQLRRLVGVALWRQIQQILEEEISKGVHQPGEQLPTEAQLAERFSVNRHTVRRALAGLEEKGVVRVEQGRGTFVHEQVIDYRLGKRTRFTENLSSQSRSASGSLLEVSEEPADEKVAAALGLAVGTAVIRLLKVGEADGRRISISDHWYPAARCRGIDVHFRATGSLSESLHALGIGDYTRQSTRIIARIPSGADADHLRQPRSRPVLVTESVNVDAQGEVVEFGVTRWASDWVQIIVD